MLVLVHSIRSIVSKDNFQDSIYESDWKLDLLLRYADALEEWERSKRAGLTAATFLQPYLAEVCANSLNCRALLLDQSDIQSSEEGHSFSSDDVRRLSDMPDRGGLATPAYSVLLVTLSNSQQKIQKLK